MKREMGDFLLTLCLIFSDRKGRIMEKTGRKKMGSLTRWIPLTFRGNESWIHTHKDKLTQQATKYQQTRFGKQCQTLQKPVLVFLFWLFPCCILWKKNYITSMLSHTQTNPQRWFSCTFTSTWHCADWTGQSIHAKNIKNILQFGFGGGQEGTHMPSMFSLIKNKSRRFEGDQIPS